MDLPKPYLLYRVKIIHQQMIIILLLIIENIILIAIL